MPPRVPLLAERWWPWASGPLAEVPAPWLWPALLPYPTRCPTTFQTSMVTQPLSRNHTPRKIPAPCSKFPLPLYSTLFFLLPQCCHLLLQQQLRRLQTAACQSDSTRAGSRASPQAPSPPTRADSGLIPRPWDCSPVPSRASGFGVYLVLSLWAFQATTYMHSGIPPGRP